MQYLPSVPCRATERHEGMTCPLRDTHCDLGTARGCGLYIESEHQSGTALAPIGVRETM